MAVKIVLPIRCQFFAGLVYVCILLTTLLSAADSAKTSTSGERVAIHVFGIQKYPQIDLVIKHLQSSSKMVKEARLRAVKVGEFIFEVMLKISAKEFVAQSKMIQVGEMKLNLTEQDKEKLVYQVEE